MLYSRRELATLCTRDCPRRPPASGIVGLGLPGEAKLEVRGVKIGMNVPYNFGGRTTPDEDLQNCVQLGVSGVELRSQPVEAFLGVPAELVAAGAGGGRRRPARPTGRRSKGQRRRASQVARRRPDGEGAGVPQEVRRRRRAHRDRQGRRHLHDSPTRCWTTRSSWRRTSAPRASRARSAVAQTRSASASSPTSTR